MLSSIAQSLFAAASRIVYTAVSPAIEVAIVRDDRRKMLFRLPSETSIGPNSSGLKAVCSLYSFWAKGKRPFFNLVHCFEAKRLDHDLQLRIAHSIQARCNTGTRLISAS
ncbi:uncharacterized protein TrAtP1_004016 [Trichoderma atroviride]|uniref:uncharacterized protein n=1 Tax=Hypocrea atroviridis TaxID=63577 RepID=UPI00331DD525|nr:hypothetical protein TrAtP1_004016 [Trichoderma atroviride]